MKRTFIFLVAFCGVTLPVLMPQIATNPPVGHADPPQVKVHPPVLPPKVSRDDSVIFPRAGTGPFIPKPTGPVAGPPLPPAVLYTPDSSVNFAAADLRSVPESERKYMRYLSLYNIPKALRADFGRMISFVVNSLGTRRKIYIPVFVGDSDETVIRLNMEDYEWNSKAWEDLATKGSGVRPSPEPYFHAFLDKFIPGEEDTKVVKKQVKKKVKKPVTREKRVWSPQFRGHVIETVTEEVEVEEIVEEEIIEKVPGKATRKRVFDRAPWVNLENIKFLEKWAESEAPIMRADWFVVNVMLPPSYYDFLKLGKNIKDFDNLVFANEELAVKARSQDRAIAITSIVARNNRILLRSPTFTNGYRWTTRDFLSSIDEKQVATNLLTNEADATEDIGTLPNGLQAYYLTNGKGERVDFANPDIAIDSTAVDKVVRTGRSCIICHAEGIRPIEDEIRTLTKRLQNREQVKLLVTDRDQARKIEDLFGSNLDEQIVKDNNIYAAAVANTNGLKTEVNAKLLGEIYNSYVETLLTKEVVARDVGVPLAELDRYVKLSNDPVVLSLIKTPIRPVRRDQWERSFQGLMLVVNTNRASAVPVQQQQIILQPVPIHVPKE